MKPEQIKALRNYMGWTQARLALRLGVQLATVSRWECDTKHPGVTNRRKLRGLAKRAGFTFTEEVNHGNASPS